ncbi:hypothetical protein PCE31107_00380 [Pandoraea cepalis]|uniref:Uncharacterized protein n=1 Tax=Pandoraea cepalis TaxID=2508294 RepID=A0A5E4RX45_9BURK|nr:hypothetical protein PCE31107_00380 [Pandoraea cepalis]
MLSAPLLAHAAHERCSAPWRSVEPVFEASIRYGDPVHKTDPFITVHVNGRLVRMRLDTGSNRHVIAVGMDVLRNRMVFHDNARLRLALLERTDASPPRQLPQGT